MKKEFLFRALGDVGDDLLHMAEHKKFSSPWKKWGALAACLALIVSLSALALPYFPMGCGSSNANESASSDTAMPEMNEESSVVEAETPAEEAPAEVESPTGEEAAVEDSVEAGEPELDQAAGTTRVTVCSTVYYIKIGVTLDGQKPGNVGEYLADVTDSNDEALIGCPVYAVMYTTWYSNYAVDGQSVPQDIYIDGPDGWLYATTGNEKTVARHTAAEVQSAIASGDTRWVLDELVHPVQAQNVVLLDGGRVADSESLNRLFLASLQLNTGVALNWLWAQEDGSLLVPVADVEYRLGLFLDQFTYEPEETAAWEPGTGMLHFGNEALSRSAGNLTLDRASVSGDRVWLWVEEAGAETCYELHFDEECWRYVNIEGTDGEPESGIVGN